MRKKSLSTVSPIMKPLLPEESKVPEPASPTHGDPGFRTIMSFPDELARKAKGIVPNVMKTGRYNIFTFIPQSMFEQFRRLANVYFLCMGCIAAVGSYTKYYETAVAPEGILLPMLLVIAISMVKEGVEDIKRHQTDAKINAKIARMISPTGEVKPVQWRHLVPGDVVLLMNNDELPADVVCLACGGVQGEICYVETAAIDGETNLKPREPCLVGKNADGTVSATGADFVSVSLSSTLSRATSRIGRSSTVVTRQIPRRQSHALAIPGLFKQRFVHNFKHKVLGISPLDVKMEIEQPTEAIHVFNGALTFRDGHSDPRAPPVSHQVTLTKDNLLLRGSILRASEWCVGIVAYTGRESKLALNSKKAPSKLSSIDRIVNYTLIVAIFLLVVVCLISMVMNIIWTYDNNTAIYLCLNVGDLDGIFSSSDGGGCNSGNTSSVLTIFTFATLYNMFVCISMYVSLEMVYLAQSYFISNDLKIYCEITDTPAECHSSGSCADLGQVQYVLSDKTGTLTKNLMKVRRMSVNAVKYGAPMDDPAAAAKRKSAVSAGQAADWLPLPDLRLHESSAENSNEINAGKPYGPYVEECLRVMVACSTVILMPDATGQVTINSFDDLDMSLQAESPDEVALVLSAAQHGDYLLVQRKMDRMLIRKPLSPDGLEEKKKLSSMKSNDSGPVSIASALESDSYLSSEDMYDHEEVQVLAINAFESDRKRMSVLVLLPQTGKYMLLVKGADSSMLPLCTDAPKAIAAPCNAHIEEFANTGLRTLVLAHREVSPQEAKDWLQTFKAASNNISNRLEMLSKCAYAIEKNLTLLGALGIEDELQDDVQGCIGQLQKAGLNVWMITGDKAETAMAISRQCGLLHNDHEVEKIIGLTGPALQQRIADLTAFLEKCHAEEQAENVGRGSDQSTLSARESTQSNIALGMHIPERTSKAPNGSNGRNSPKGSAIAPSKRKLALVVDGISLEAMAPFPEVKLQFTAAVQSIPTVVACRVSPKQKAALVNMVKTGAGKPVTLAIGDGANDVGMIHEARVGVGIAGKEGRHAANSADFAIGQFRFLAPLLLEHGRYNYIRCSNLVLYSFYKNLVLAATLLYYGIYNGVSGTVYIDSLILTGYNFYLGWPIVIYGALDLDVPLEAVNKYPYLAYATGRFKETLNLKNMARWCLNAYIQGLVLFAVYIRLVEGPVYQKFQNFEFSMAGIGLSDEEGRQTGIFVEGFALYTALVIAMQYKVIYMTNSHTYINWLFLLLSMFGYFAFCYMYGLFPLLDFYAIFNVAVAMPTFWLILFIAPVVMMMVDIVTDRFIDAIMPNSQSKLKALLLEDTLYETHNEASMRGSEDNNPMLRAFSVSENNSVFVGETGVWKKENGEAKV